MKILLVIDNLGSGGAQRQMVILAKWLKQNQYDVHFFHYYPQDFFLSELKELCIPIHYVPKKHKLGIEVIKGLNQILRREKYNFVLSFLNTPNLYSIIAKQLSKCATINITSERSKTNFNLKNVRLFFKKWAHKKSDWIICNSNHEKNNWSEYFPVVKNKISTIYNGIDLDKFFPRVQGYKRNNSFLCIGRVEPGKNGLYIIEVLNFLVKKGISIKITWLGHITFSDGSRKNYFESMCNKIQEYHLESNWNWLTPALNVREIIHSHDALIHPSTIEGLPNVICESLASGVPVFAADLLDHPILVKEDETGFLFDASDPLSLVNAITKFSGLDDMEYERMCSNARFFAEKELSIEKMINSYKKLFDQIAI
ncbi:MAG: glycosyltransferase family 4 protein [Ferruginibacter sp.]